MNEGKRLFDWSLKLPSTKIPDQFLSIFVNIALYVHEALFSDKPRQLLEQTRDTMAFKNLNKLGQGFLWTELDFHDL